MATTKQRAKSQARVQKTAPILFHEKLNNQHRIVRLEFGKPPVAGDWVHNNEIACLDNLRAVTVEADSVLPVGIFKATPVDHVS